LNCLSTSLRLTLRVFTAFAALPPCRLARIFAQAKTVTKANVVEGDSPRSKATRRVDAAQKLCQAMYGVISAIFLYYFSNITSHFFIYFRVYLLLGKIIFKKYSFSFFTAGITIK
jgi:hypothetical protein